jgi:hypothetical protein
MIPTIAKSSIPNSVVRYRGIAVWYRTYTILSFIAENSRKFMLHLIHVHLGQVNTAMRYLVATHHKIQSFRSMDPTVRLRKGNCFSSSMCIY